MADPSKLPPDTLLVFVTAPSGAATTLARTLVEERLVACVNVVPGVRSIYRWQGEVSEDEESLLVLKTVGERFEMLERRVRELHAYEVPEIVAVRIDRGSAPYLAWLAAQVGGG